MSDHITLVFGWSTITGGFFRDQCSKSAGIIKVGRTEQSDIFVDLSSGASIFEAFKGQDLEIISIVPIWLFVNYLKSIYLSNGAESLACIRRIICVSSTSAVTKRFAFNKEDKQLAKQLFNAEEELVAIGADLSWDITVIRTALVYGSRGNKTDKNLRAIAKVMSTFPLIILPRETGLRQPIHAKQLACVLHFLRDRKVVAARIQKLDLGGNTILSYEEMINMYINSLPPKHRARHCRILKVSSRLFILFTAPLLLFRLKYFEAATRICSDLAGFRKVSDLVESSNDGFPVGDTSQA